MLSGGCFAKERTILLCDTEIEALCL